MIIKFIPDFQSQRYVDHGVVGVELTCDRFGLFFIQISDGTGKWLPITMQHLAMHTRRILQGNPLRPSLRQI